MRPQSRSRAPASDEVGVIRIDRAIAKLAARQRSVVARWQLLAMGIAPRTINHRVASGLLRPLYRGVYLVGHTVPPPWAREMAALIAYGDRAILSHWTAADVWALPAPSQPAIDVIV